MPVPLSVKSVRGKRASLPSICLKAFGSLLAASAIPSPSSFQSSGNTSTCKTPLANTMSQFTFRLPQEFCFNTVDGSVRLREYSLASSET